MTTIGGPSSERACGPGSSGAARRDWVPAAYACPRRWFSGLPRSKPNTYAAHRRAPPESVTGKLLRELQTVSVGVEHVHEPHLAVQLEHDPDLQTC